GVARRLVVRSPQRKLFRRGRLARGVPVADSGTLPAVAAWRRAVLGIHRSLEPGTPRESTAGHRTIRADAGLRTSVLEFGGRPLRERFVAAAVYGRSVAACRIAYRSSAGCPGAPNPA